MLKAEKELREFIKKNTEPLILEKRDGFRLVANLIKEVKENRAKAVEDCEGGITYDRIDTAGRKWIESCPSTIIANVVRG